MPCNLSYNIISTGSRGNAVILNDTVLIDCGVSFKALRPAIRPLKLVLMTHSHSDHFNKTTVRTLVRERPSLRFGCGPWMAGPLSDCGVPKSSIDLVYPNMMYDYGICRVSPVNLVHSVPNYGYKVHFPDCKVFYATDTANLNGIHAPHYDLYMVEANYETDEIKERIAMKKAEGKFIYEFQAMENHLSREQCDDFIYRNIGRDGTYVYLHCHQDISEKAS